MAEVFGNNGAMSQALANVQNGQILGSYTTLFRLINADMNSTADQLFVPAFNFTQWSIRDIDVTGASVPITTAAGGIYTGAGKTGTALVAAGQSWIGLTSSVKLVNPTLAATIRDLRTGVPILSLTTPMGSAATASFYIMGIAG